MTEYCCICEQPITPDANGEMEFFIMPNGTIVCTSKICMDAVRRKPA
jgi:hypothetical protein